MSFIVLLVSSDDKVRRAELNHETLISFFKQERRMFAEDLSILTPIARKTIESNFKNTNGHNLGAIHIFGAMALAGEKKHTRVINFIKTVQKQYSCQYIVGR